jgi:hypothetical protein
LRAFFNHQLESQVRNALKQEGKNEEEISARLEHLKSGKIEVSVLMFLFKEALPEIKEEKQQQLAFLTFLDIFHLINKIFFYIPDPFTNERNHNWVLVPYNVSSNDQRPELWTEAKGEKKIVCRLEFYCKDPLPPSLLSECIIRCHKICGLCGIIKDSYFWKRGAIIGLESLTCLLQCIGTTHDTVKESYRDQRQYKDWPFELPQTSKGQRNVLIWAVKGNDLQMAWNLVLFFHSSVLEYLISSYPGMILPRIFLDCPNNVGSKDSDYQHGTQSDITTAREDAEENQRRLICRECGRLQLEMCHPEKWQLQLMKMVKEHKLNLFEMESLDKDKDLWMVDFEDDFGPILGTFLQ